MRIIRFIIVGDSKGKEHGINESVLTKILSKSSKLNPEPEFIVLLGDMVAGSEDENILDSQLKRLRKMIEKFYPNKLLLPVIGNHEVNIEPEDDRYEKVFEQNFKDLSPDGVLQNYNSTVYYKDFENIRIIILNSFHFNNLHKVDEKQLNWLEYTASDTNKIKILFVHSPAYPTGAHLGHCLDLYPEYRDSFWETVDKCNISIVFSGHEHNYSRRKIDSSFNSIYSRSIYQVISGGGGEKLKNKYKNKKGVLVKPIDTYHFLTADVETNLLKVCAITYKGKKVDEFTVT